MVERDDLKEKESEECGLSKGCTTTTGTDGDGHTACVDDEAAGTLANGFCIELTLFDGISSGAPVGTIG
jgi:hypothetical protein